MRPTMLKFCPRCLLHPTYTLLALLLTLLRPHPSSSLFNMLIVQPHELTIGSNFGAHFDASSLLSDPESLPPSADNEPRYQDSQDRSSFSSSRGSLSEFQRTKQRDGPIPLDSDQSDGRFGRHNAHVRRRTESINLDSNKESRDAYVPVENEQSQSCRSDRHCNRETSFCDKHYRLCVPHRQVGDICRKDSHCVRGLDCMFGRCLPHVQDKYKGARCNPDDDDPCNPGLCCARQHGEWICKATLKLNQYCFVPNGGLAYSLNEKCPCDDGLTCQQVQLNGSGLDWLRPWNEQRRYRCLRHP